MNYFVRYGITRPLRLPTGDIVPFASIGDDTGILETNSNLTISELRKLQAQQRMGVKEVSAEAFDELKKKASAGELRLRSVRSRSAEPELRVERLDQGQKSAAGESSLLDPTVGASQKPGNGHPLEVPSEIPLPPSIAKATKPVAGKPKKAARKSEEE